MNLKTLQKGNKKKQSNSLYRMWLQEINNISNQNDIKKIQHKEAVQRYRFINKQLNKTLTIDRKKLMM